MVATMSKPSSIPLNRIDENIWEIPKSFRPGMNVPGRIYANESLIQKMGEDLTLPQCTNVAHLPGILKYSITMPDGHQGYGFPIGGVAAFDSEDGVISPGGVGYDINCLPAGSLVLTPDGYRVPIEEALRHGKTISVNDKKATPSKITLGLKRSERSLLKITTETGFTIRVTKDHPLLTQDGMVLAKSLNLGTKTALHPFKGEVFDPPQKFPILSKDDFSPSISKELEKRGLLPICSDSRALPALLRILGYFVGDGSFSGKRTWFYGSHDGMEEMKQDLTILGYTPSKIIVRKRQASINGKNFLSIENSVYICARSFRTLLVRLGAPPGNKVTGQSQLPLWLLRLPRWLQRCFLAGYFGAEMNKPQTTNGYNFEPPMISCTKHKSSLRSGINLLGMVAAMLENFGVEPLNILSEDLGEKVRLKLPLSEKPESLMNLWSRVSYAYNPKRKRLALAATAWLTWKQSVIVERSFTALAVGVVHAGGKSLSQIASEYEQPWVNRRHIERNLYEGRDTSSRVPQGFPKFEDWASERMDGDVIWDTITNIREVLFDGEVFDIGVDDPSHNFVAECFIVSNCGIRLLLTSLEQKDVKPKLQQLVNNLFEIVPSGLGSKGGIRLDTRQLDDVLDRGVEWAVEKGYGWEEDARHCEEGGRMSGADHAKVSQHAKGRGSGQLGTLGSGNHFLEVEFVEKIYDPIAAKTFGLSHEGQVVVMVHSGSRGLGHQVCSDFLHVMERAVSKYNIKIPDRELACAPASSPEASEYFAAMSAACNYAWVNRQCIAHWTREAFSRTFNASPEHLGMHLVYDVAHNLAKREVHEVDGKKTALFVHRKGATRAFPAGREEIPQEYRSVGQPVIIPGSMGTASYLLVGGPRSLELSWGSTAHGAGRFMSREGAVRKYWGSDVKRELESRGIIVKAADIRVMAEEAPGAYKDVDKVAEVSHNLGIATLVARMVPMGVTKG
jgi:tRNA-splicing ligase RtcB